MDIVPPVAISVLGAFQLTLAGRQSSITSESKAAHLLLCLVLAHQHRLLRTQLVERLWPNTEPALAGQSLHSLIHSLHKNARTVLQEPEIIIYDRGAYHLNIPGGVWIDVDQFERWRTQGKQLLVQGQETEGIRYCKQAIALYQGDLWGDIGLELVIERERLRAAFLDLLACLADYHYSHHEPTVALDLLQRLLAHDPCREDAHRQVMRCYMQLGQRAQALRQYRLCCQILAHEFEARPEPTTVALFEQVRLDPGSLSSY
ncbi:MAG: bacterial transcriptional activator domain-containing protein [Caldilineaceae bacterium]